MNRSYSLAQGYKKEDLEFKPPTSKERPPNVIKSLLLIITFSVFLILSFIIFVPWIQTVEGAGRLVALNPGDREQSISALVPGRISEWHIRKGELVEKGQLIASIVDNDPALIERLQSQLYAAERRVESSDAALETARLNAARQAELLADGLVSQLDMEKAKIKVSEFEIKVRSAQEDVNRARVALSREGRQEVRAPRAGVITNVLGGGPATYVQAGAPLVRFIPSDINIVAEVYIDSRDVPLITPGRTVQMQFEGWPVFQFSGWPDVSIGGFTGEVLFVDPIAQTDGRFRILVQESKSGNAWPAKEKLRLATPVRAWVLLDEVPVYYELWRRLNNFPPDFPAIPVEADIVAGKGAYNVS